MKNKASVILPLIALLMTVLGDLAGYMVSPDWVWVLSCCLFGITHLCLFSYLVRRGRFSWECAGLMLFLLCPFLAAFVFPKVPNRLEVAFTAYALVSICSLSAAIGARKTQGGLFYLCGILALVISDVFIALEFAGCPWAFSWCVPIYVSSNVLLLVALVRSISLPSKEEKIVELPVLVRQHRNACFQLWLGCLMPFLFLAAMYFYNGNYCWYSDYISESGLVFVRGMRPNHLGALFLTAGLTGSGILCGWYFEERFRWGRGFLWQRGLILLFGVIGAIGLAGIGAAPYDQHPDLHNFFTLCSVPFGGAILLASVTGDDIFGRWTEKVIWLVFLLFAMAIVASLAYLKRLETGGFPGNPTGPLIQKITVLSFYVYMLGQVIAFWGRTRKTREKKG